MVYSAWPAGDPSDDVRCEPYCNRQPGDPLPPGIDADGAPNRQLYVYALGGEAPSAAIRSVPGESRIDLVALHTDPVGNVRLLTHDSGVTLASLAHDPFGGLAASPLPTGPEQRQRVLSWVPHAYHGRTSFADLDLVHMGARWYSTAQQRWLSPDPAGLLDGTNRFLFAGANPLRFVDPWGLKGREQPRIGVNFECCAWGVNSFIDTYHTREALLEDSEREVLAHVGSVAEVNSVESYRERARNTATLEQMDRGGRALYGLPAGSIAFAAGSATDASFDDRIRAAELADAGFGVVAGFAGPNARGSATPRIVSGPQLNSRLPQVERPVASKGVADGRVRFRRWRRGEAIDKPLPDGSAPSWDTVRSRYWKNRYEAAKGTHEFSRRNLRRMSRGRAPLDFNPRTGKWESRELHHVNPRRAGGGDHPLNLRELTPDWHGEVDPFRYTVPTTRGIR